MYLQDLKSRSYFSNIGNYIQVKFNELLLFSLYVSYFCFALVFWKTGIRTENISFFYIIYVLRTENKCREKKMKTSVYWFYYFSFKKCLGNTHLHGNAGVHWQKSLTHHKLVVCSDPKLYMQRSCSGYQVGQSWTGREDRDSTNYLC